MQYLITSILILLVTVSASAQEFSFPLYFEDATGAKDTLIYGYDEDATDGIDPDFGEENLINEVSDSAFSVTLTEYSFISAMEYTVDTPDTKVNIQIKEKQCDESDFPYVSAVVLENVEFPVEVSWDSTLFFDDCLVESLITDTHPGGWFDVSGTETIYFLKDQSSTNFNSSIYHYIEYYIDGTDRIHTDTIDVLFFALGSEEGGIVNSIDHELSEEVKVFPVPARNTINIDLPDNHRLDNFSVLNIKGEKQSVNREGSTFYIENLVSGTYFLHLRLGGKNVVKKFIKK